MAWLAASLPWRNHSILGVYGVWFRTDSKPLWLTALESLTLYALVVAGVFLLEMQSSTVSTQGWQFWVVMLCLWLVLSFPAAAWYRLKKK